MRYFDRNTWLWVLAAAIFLLPGLNYVPLLDQTEVLLAEISREMIASGSWLQPPLNYSPAPIFPPLFFWLQSLSMELWGVGEWAARFPNALLGFVVLPFLYICGKFLVDRKFGFFWALTWLGSFLPMLYLKSGMIDPLFNFLFFCSLFFIIHYLWKRQDEKALYLARRSQSYLLLGAIFMGLALLTRGIMAYGLLVITLVFYRLVVNPRHFITLRHFFIYSLLALSFLVLWMGLDIILHGPGFILDYWAAQGELYTGLDLDQRSFPGYHFLVLLVGCFPASIFALRALGPIESIKPHTRDFQRWMITLLIVVLIFFSLVGSKEVHYSSLAYYPLTFLAALTLWHVTEFPRRYRRWLTALVMIVGLIPVAAGVLIPWLGQRPQLLQRWWTGDPFALAKLQAEVHWDTWHYLPSVFLFLVLLVYSSFVGKNPRFAFRSLFFGTAIWTLLFLGFFLPPLERYTQAAPVEFFGSYQEEDVYVTTYGYKSYIPWFYSQVPPYENARARSREWLLHGTVDKPVIISTRVTRLEELEAEIPDARIIFTRNGYYFYRRPASRE